MPRCDECKHWKRVQDDWTADGIGYRECAAARPRWKIQDDAMQGMEYGVGNYEEKRRAALAASKAYVQDGSEYRAELITAPDFFCALFQEADASQ